MSDSRYTYEEMEIARFTDLPNLAEAFGYEVQARGRWHFLKDAQHIVIKNRTRYFDNYKQEWGDAITFLEDYADMSFRETMDFLLNYNGYARDAPAQKPEIRLPKKEEKQPVPFALPEPNEDNRRVFSYLRKRGIAYQVIENMVNAGLLYEDIQQASANLKAECRSAQIAHLCIHHLPQRIGQSFALSVFQHELDFHVEYLLNM